MKQLKQHTADKVFKAIADANRRQIFHLLVVAGAAMSMTQIAEKFDISRQGVTKHIKMLEDAGLVETEAKGRERFCIAQPKQLKAVKDWLAFYDKFWDNKLGDLGKFLDGEA